MRQKEEVLMDQITQPHYPTHHKTPDYTMELAHPLSSRHLEKNVALGPAEEATELYGPDLIDYQRCKDIFENCRNGFIGIVLHAGDAGDTMEEHVYYEEKFKLMQ